MKAFRGTLAFRPDQNCARARQSRGQSVYGAKRARKLACPMRSRTFGTSTGWISAIPIPSIQWCLHAVASHRSPQRPFVGLQELATWPQSMFVYRSAGPPTVLACGNWYHLLHCGLSSSMCDFASSVPPADVARTLRIPGKTRTLLVLPSHACLCVRACVRRLPRSAMNAFFGITVRFSGEENNAAFLRPAWR
jgi:hypothetical protein